MAILFEKHNFILLKSQFIVSLRLMGSMLNVMKTDFSKHDQIVLNALRPIFHITSGFTGSDITAKDLLGTCKQTGTKQVLVSLSGWVFTW